MSREAGKTTYKATVETPCDNHGPRAVTITGDGEQVWGAAVATKSVIEKNNGAVTMHFYVDDKEVDWRDTMDVMHLCLALSGLLNGAPFRHKLEDLPF